LAAEQSQNSGCIAGEAPNGSYQTISYHAPHAARRRHEAFNLFLNKEDECVKVVLRP